MDICLKKLAEEDFDSYYKLRCDNKNVLNTGHSKIPEYNSLKNWVKNIIKEDKKKIYLAACDNKCVGYLQIDFKDITAEIGYGVYDSNTNKGIGTAIIKECIKLIEKEFLCVDKVVAWIAEFNYYSTKCVLKNNFIKSGQTRIQFYSGFDKEFTIQEYVYKIKQNI